MSAQVESRERATCIDREGKDRWPCGGGRERTSDAGAVGENHKGRLRALKSGIPVGAPTSVFGEALEKMEHFRRGFGEKSALTTLVKRGFS